MNQLGVSPGEWSWLDDIFGPKNPDPEPEENGNGQVGPPAPTQTGVPWQLWALGGAVAVVLIADLMLHRKG